MRGGGNSTRRASLTEAKQAQCQSQINLLEQWDGRHRCGQLSEIRRQVDPLEGVLAHLLDECRAAHTEQRRGMRHHPVGLP